MIRYVQWGGIFGTYSSGTKTTLKARDWPLNTTPIASMFGCALLEIWVLTYVKGVCFWVFLSWYEVKNIQQFYMFLFCGTTKPTLFLSSFQLKMKPIVFVNFPSQNIMFIFVVYCDQHSGTHLNLVQICFIHIFYMFVQDFAKKIMKN